MSERLEPGRLVSWQHGSELKAGHVLLSNIGYHCTSQGLRQLVVQCSDGVYLVDTYLVTEQQPPADWGFVVFGPAGGGGGPVHYQPPKVIPGPGVHQAKGNEGPGK